MLPEITPEEIARKRRRQELALRIGAVLFGIMFLALLVLDIRRAFFRG